MVSFTYCVSRYNDKTALSVFVSLHISHPEPRWRLMWDKRLSSDREGSYRNTTLVAAVVACRAASYTRKSTSTSMAWRTEGTRRCGPWNNRAKRRAGPSSPQRREVCSMSLHARSAHAGSARAAPRSETRARGSPGRCRRRGGDVARKDASKETQAIRTYNERLSKDPRMIAAIVPLRDGVSVALKVRG